LPDRLLASKGLIVDSKLNTGATSRDALQRIEVEQERVAVEHVSEAGTA
jgi:hypothetical protein